MKLYYISILLIFSTILTSQNANNLELKKIYLSTNGQGWLDKSGWIEGINNPNIDPCVGPWKGILCSGNIIISIDLSNNKLTGSLPSEINLPNLKIFKAAGNGIGGEIPLFGNFLQQIDLRKNKLTGEIPAYLIKYKDVQTGSFAFSDNDLSGCFPIWIAQFAPGKFGTLGNPKLPYYGDHTKVFSQGQPQIGAKCDDSIAVNNPDFINPDCTCHDAGKCKDVFASRSYSVCYGMQFNFNDTFYSAGVYNNIRITNSNNCDTIFNLTIKNYPEINFNLGQDKQVCQNTAVEIGIQPLPPAQGITYTYNWSNGISGPMQTVSPNITTDYTLTVANNYNCSKSDVIKVTVLAKINIPINVAVCKGEQYLYKGELLSVGTYERSSGNQSGCDTLFKITVAEKPEIKVLAELSIKCDSNQNIKLSDRLEMEPSDGTWKEVSVKPSSGGFNATAGTFNPFNQKPGTYIFSYMMKPGSYCGPSSREVKINVTECDNTSECLTVINPDSMKVIQGDYTIDILKNDVNIPSDLKLMLVEYDSDLLFDVNINNSGILNFSLMDTLLQPTNIRYSAKSIDCIFQTENTLKLLSNRVFDIFRTSVITPNGDGFNDVLRFNDLGTIKGSELWIYNRWGNKIYHTKEYKNDWNGEGLTGGTYYYILKIDGETYKSSLAVEK